MKKGEGNERKEKRSERKGRKKETKRREKGNEKEKRRRVFGKLRKDLLVNNYFDGIIDQKLGTHLNLRKILIVPKMNNT